MIKIKDRFEISDNDYHYTVGYYTSNKWSDNNTIVAARSKSPEILNTEYEVELVKISIDTGEKTVLCNDCTGFIDYLVYKNLLYYITGKEIKKINLDTGKTTILYKDSFFADIENAYMIMPEITNDGKFLSVYTHIEGKTTAFIVIDTALGTAKKLFEKSFSEPFSIANHGMICPTDPDIMFFAHEGDTRYVSNRLWIYDDKTGKMYNLTKQRLDEDGNLADCFGHESWAPDGKGMYFVKYTVSPSAPTGICYVDLKTGQSKLIYSSFPYWHVGASSDNKYLIADTYANPSEVVVIDKADNTEYSIDTVGIFWQHPAHPHPQMSPDSQTAIYTAVNDNGRICIKGTSLIL